MKDRFDINSERICGYEVSCNRKKLWICELDMLAVLDDICEELGIQYFACFGTAIGAVRHRGFIPWDDDIDLGMLREDFNIFLQKGKKCFPKYIDVQYGMTENGCNPLLRIRDSRTTGIINSEYRKNGNKGCFIEIYPFDYVNDNKIRIIQLKISKHCLLEIYKRYQPLKEAQGKTRSLGGKLRSIIFKPFKTKHIWYIYEKACEWQNKCKENCKYVDTITLPNYAVTGQHLFEKEDVEETVWAKFEYSKIRIPKGYDHVLQTRYGDYMKLPPLEQRGTHHDNIVFYDPNVPYTEYERSDIPKKYFEGDCRYGLL